jgi:hypothetical protein
MRRIEIGALQRDGYFAAPNWRREGGQIFGTARIEWGGILLEICNQVIEIRPTPCRFGGHRLWFRCVCGRHVSALYSPNGGRWACRHCHQLTYATRQAIPRDRQLLRAQRIRRRLGGSANMLEAFPPKPKGMHSRTYERLRRAHDLAEQKAIAGFSQFLDLLDRQLGV